MLVSLKVSSASGVEMQFTCHFEVILTHSNYIKILVPLFIVVYFDSLIKLKTLVFNAIIQYKFVCGLTALYDLFMCVIYVYIGLKL